MSYDRDHRRTIVESRIRSLVPQPLYEGVLDIGQLSFGQPKRVPYPDGGSVILLPARVPFTQDYKEYNLGILYSPGGISDEQHITGVVLANGRSGIPVLPLQKYHLSLEDLTMTIGSNLGTIVKSRWPEVYKTLDSNLKNHKKL